MTKSKRFNLIICMVILMICSLFAIGILSSVVTVNAAGIDYTTKTFTNAPSSITVDDEKYVYKVSCFSPRGLVDEDYFDDYITSISFRASMGCQIYFVDGKACNREDSYYGDYEWNEYANYYDILYYDATNHFVYIRFKNLAYLDDDEEVSASLEDMCFLYDETTYNPAPQRIHYDIFAPTGNFYNTSGTKISSYYYKNAFYYTATDEGEGVSYVQYKKPGSTSWSTYTNGSTIAKTSGNGVYTFRAVDKQGNVSSESSIYLDATAPTGYVYANGSILASGGKTSASSIYYSASDACGISKCYVRAPGSNSYVQYSNGASLTESGSYSFYCVDLAGNISSTYTVLMDNDNPTLTCDIAEFSETVNKAFTVTASDALSSVTLYYKSPGQTSYTACSQTSMTIPVSNPDANIISTQKMRYCGSTVKYRSAEGIYKENHNNMMLYVCTNYPECDAYVRVHEGTNKPVGTLANAKLRAMRLEAHKLLDKIQNKGIMTKNECYQWIANTIMAPLSQAHIGYLGEYYCQIVIDECKKLLNRKKMGRHSLSTTNLERRRVAL